MKAKKKPEPEVVDVSPVGRRVRMRRTSGSGFSNSGLSDSTVAEGAPVGGGVDLNAQVRQIAVEPPAAALQPPPGADVMPAADETPIGQNADEFNPAARLAMVRGRSSEYEREYRLGLLHRMLMRNIPLDEIARQMQVSMSTLMRDRTELKARLREAARELNIDEMVGHNKGFYEDVAAMSLRAASMSTNPLPMRLSALRTALAANNDMHRMLQAAGVYDVLRFRRVPGGDGASDIQRMLSLTEELFADGNRDARQAAQPNPLGSFSGIDTEHPET